MDGCQNMVKDFHNLAPSLVRQVWHIPYGIITCCVSAELTNITCIFSSSVTFKVSL